MIHLKKITGVLRNAGIILVFLLGLITIVASGGGGGSSKKGDSTAIPDPVADAGTDRTGVTTQNLSSPDTHEIVFLDAASSTGNEWAWSLVSQTASGTYKFTSANTQVTGFYANQAGEYTLQLQVGNGKGKTETDTVVVKLIDDMDNDGLEDDNDLDRDGDGFLNTADLFPDDKASHYDFDSDGTGNYYESDVDGDGISDITDDFPLSATASVFSTYAESTETSASNQNDGIGRSETAGSVPRTITGAISATGGRTDIDYFNISFSTAGRYSVILTGADTDMTPAIAVMESTGAAVNSTTANIPYIAGSTAISIYIGTTGNYYLSATDNLGKSNADWTYTIKIFVDEDLDGVPDDLEKALDSNHLTADSDGDGISDYLEIYKAISNWTLYKDADNDGLPPWWDLDSDGDMIPDAVEYFDEDERSDLSATALASLNDADADGIPNFIDDDSDGNSIDDADEYGANPTNPDDTDKDGTPDYADVDDDGDGILDVNDNDRLTALTSADLSDDEEIMSIDRLYNNTVGTDNVARSDDSVTIYGANLPSATTSTWITIRGENGVINLNPTTIDTDTLTFTWPSDFASGLVEVFIASGGTYSNSLGVVIPASNAPILTDVTVNAGSGSVTFTGLNLNDTLTVYFSEASTTSSNSYGSATSFTVYIPYGAKRGDAYVSGSGGSSNVIWVDLARSFSGSITLPVGSSVSMTSLDVSWALSPDTEINPDSSGYFTTTGAYNGPTTVTAMVEDTNASTYTYAVFLEAISLPGDYSITLNSQSTALALVWDAIGVQGLVSETSLGSAKTLLQGLSEITDLGSLLETKLAKDPYVLNKNNSDITKKMKTAITAAAEAISDGISDQTLTPAVSLAASLSKQLRALSDATITPTEVDDIMVTAGDDGNVSVENDTQLYMSVKITASNGKVLQPHISGIRGMAGPQGYGLLFWAATSSFTQPKGQNCTVQVVTPGSDKAYDPKIAASTDIYKWLVVRTVVERVLWPPISSVISVKMNPGDLASIILNNALGMPGIIDDFAQGNVADGVKGLVMALWQDLSSAPPGPITKAIAVRYGAGFAEEAIKKLAAKIGVKLIPGLGWVSAAYDAAGHVSNGVNAGKAVDDLIRTDSVIDFNVKFPLQIDSVEPSKVKPDGKDKKFLIKGLGFGEIVSGYVFTTTYRPRITFTDNKGYETTNEPDYISGDGTKMSVTVPGWFLDEYTEGPLDVTVLHPKNIASSTVTKEDAVEIVTKVEISSISPDQGGSGVPATVYGAGFSNIISDNEVMVGPGTALISSASETALKIVIPNSLTTGEYDVKARSRFDGTWSDWSNTVTYEVIQGDIVVTVSDNGGAKDDAFALYVDGVYKGTMYASDSDYTDVYTMSLSAGSHTAMLLGVEAPDSVGTYSISFSGVGTVSGDATSGEDLVPGVSKYYTFEVSVATTKAPSLIKAFKYLPKVPDKETALMRKKK
ncbi:MAG: hypothetical protein KJ737_24610 [Proteobacteria bacterium]|nr:hypothetical protein [Pseudomonadota bacterium]